MSEEATAARAGAGGLLGVPASLGVSAQPVLGSSQPPVRAGSPLAMFCS